MENKSSDPLPGIQTIEARKTFPDSISDELLYNNYLPNEEPPSQAGFLEEKRVWTDSELWDLPQEDADCLADPIYGRSGLVAVVGGSDTGKSMYLLQLAIDTVSRKSHHLEFPLKPKHHTALILCTDLFLIEFSG